MNYRFKVLAYIALAMVSTGAFLTKASASDANATQALCSSLGTNDLNSICTDKKVPRPSELIKEKEAEINQLISLASKISEKQLTSPESLELRKNLVHKLSELIQAHERSPKYALEDPRLKERSFQLHAYAAELNALKAKAAYDNKDFYKAIDNANTAIKTRKRAAEIATSLGLHQEAKKQIEYANWPTDIVKQASNQYTEELNEKLEAKKDEVSELIARKNKIAENEVTSQESLQIREDLVEKFNELVEIYEADPKKYANKNQVNIRSFHLHSYLAEWKALAAKVAFDNHDFNKAIEEAITAIGAREHAAQIAQDLGWLQEAGKQIEYANWPANIKSQARGIILQQKENAVNDLIAQKNKMPEAALTSQDSLQIRKGLVEKLNELAAMYALDPNNTEHAKQHKVKTFQAQAYLAEWKALEAKAAYNNNDFSTSIEEATIAIAARERAAHIAQDLGWHEEANRQRNNANWPANIKSQARGIILQQKENAVNDLIAQKNKMPEAALTSQDSLQIRKGLVEKLNELAAMYALDPNNTEHAKQHKVKTFQAQAYLAEWKALEAKAAYNNNDFSTSIEEATIAIAARERAAHIAQDLGWHEEANRQRNNANWPAQIANQAKEGIPNEVSQLEETYNETEDKISVLGEKRAYSYEGLTLRKKQLNTVKELESKYSSIHNTLRAQELTFKKLTLEAEINVIQAKRLLDAGLFEEAFIRANKSIEKRHAASHQASILGWTQDSILQLEFTSWPSVVAKRAQSNM